MSIRLVLVLLAYISLTSFAEVKVSKNNAKINVLPSTRASDLIHVESSPRTYFKPKGIGVAVVKSLMNWRSFAVGIKVPVTAQFPELDKIKYLPKVTSFFGVQYPFDYRVAMTGSYPLDPVLNGFARLVKSTTGLSISQETSIAQCVKRVGMTVSMLYNKNKGFRWTLGPFGQIFLSERHMKTIVLPLILLLPSILAALADYALNLIRSAVAEPVLEPAVALTSVPVSVPVPVPVPNPVSASPLSFVFAKSKRATEPVAVEIVAPVVSAKPRELKLDIEQWRRVMLAVASTKNTDLGANLGYYFPLVTLLQGLVAGSVPQGVLGSSASIDIQSFRPVVAFLAMFRQPQK